MQVIESYIISRRLRRSDLGYLYSFGEHYIGIISGWVFSPCLDYLLRLPEVMGLGWESKDLLRTDKYKVIYTYIVHTTYKVIQVKIPSS